MIIIKNTDNTFQITYAIFEYAVAMIEMIELWK